MRNLNNNEINSISGGSSHTYSCCVEEYSIATITNTGTTGKKPVEKKVELYDWWSECRDITLTLGKSDKQFNDLKNEMMTKYTDANECPDTHYVFECTTV